jgi:hypothetical protein
MIVNHVDHHRVTGIASRFLDASMRQRIFVQSGTNGMPLANRDQFFPAQWWLRGAQPKESTHKIIDTDISVTV